MTTGKTVSVIIPTYYRHSELPNILNCLAHQSYRPSEVIVVDQTPRQDRPRDFYAPFEKTLPLKVVDLEKPSSTVARNAGANLARGDILCFFDDKIRAESDLIESHLQVMEEENVDVVHGAVLHPDRYGDTLPEKFAWERQREKIDPAMIFMISANCQWHGMAIGVSTANMCIKKDVFRQVGGLDENISGRYDDIEFAYRLYRAGAKMFFSPKPLIKNKRIPFGGAYTKKSNFWSRLFRPVPHPNYLYFHMKHLPGWSTKQLIIKTMYEAYWPPINWFVRPWIIFLTPIRILRSILISRSLIKQSNRNSANGVSL